MTHNYPLPTDSEMESLIVHVYESMPVPEQSRLSLIESKLLRGAKKSRSEKRLNKIPWWIVLVLAGGFASATWWAGEQWLGNIDASDKALEKTVIKTKRDETNKEKAVMPDNKIKEQANDNVNNKSPVIFQRESF